MWPKSHGVKFLNLIHSAPMQREKADEGRCKGINLCGFSSQENSKGLFALPPVQYQMHRFFKR
jgi:hypothetical protein